MQEHVQGIISEGCVNLEKGIKYRMTLHFTYKMGKGMRRDFS